LRNDSVTVINDGQIQNVNSDSLSKGTIVLLQTGDLVPADLLLQDVNGLEVDEFDITGEIQPVKKQPGGENARVYMGSRVLKGSATGIVTAVGNQPEYGNIFKQLSEMEPYRHRISFNWGSLIPIVLIIPPLICEVVLTGGFFRSVWLGVLLSLFLFVWLNESFFRDVPATVQQKKLARQNIHISDIQTLERLGKADVLCFDKTGVLTFRRMKVQTITLADGSHIQPGDKGTALINTIYLTCALCHDVIFWEKLESANAVDEALISFAVENGIDVQRLLNSAKRFYDVPFVSENRFMECGYEINGKPVFFTKGDPSVIMQRCNSYMLSDGEIRGKDGNFWREGLSTIEKISHEGNSVIALAFTDDTVNGQKKDFTFLCYLSIGAKIMPGVTKTIEWLKNRNLRTIMLTGDRSETALKIGSDCGISRNSTLCLTGNSMLHMALNDVADQAEYCQLFARLIPSQKGILVRLLQKRGHTVVMIGDGFNDGIALKVADVGISFNSNNSEMARKLSKILINELDDLIVVLQSGLWVSRANRGLKFARFFMTGLIIGFLYIRCLLDLYSYLN